MTEKELNCHLLDMIDLLERIEIMATTISLALDGGLR